MSTLNFVVVKPSTRKIKGVVYSTLKPVQYFESSAPAYALASTKPGYSVKCWHPLTGSYINPQ